MTSRAEVAAAHIGLDHDAALAVLAADFVEAIAEAEAGDLAQGDGAGRLAGLGWEHDRQIAQGVRVVTLSLGRAYDDVEAAVAAEQQARLTPAQPI